MSKEQQENKRMENIKARHNSSLMTGEIRKFKRRI